MVDLLFLLRIADAASNPKSQFDASKINALAERIAAVRSQEMALTINDLRISGVDLMKIGMKQGKEIGEVLNYLMEKVLDEPLLNNYEVLLKLAQEYLEQKKLEKV